MLNLLDNAAKWGPPGERVEVRVRRTGNDAHVVVADRDGIFFPLLSDFEPKGEVSRAFGAYRKQDGMSERALFVLDEDGIVSWSYLSPVSVNPGADGIISALEDLSARKKASAGSEARR